MHYYMSYCRGYIIEKRSTTSGHWERASGCLSSNLTHFKVSKLMARETYLFRVIAENDQGQSQPLVMNIGITAEDPFSKCSSQSRKFCLVECLKYPKMLK